MVGSVHVYVFGAFGLVAVSVPSAHCEKMVAVASVQAGRSAMGMRFAAVRWLPQGGTALLKEIMKIIPYSGGTM